jgi:uncharacterized protein
MTWINTATGRRFNLAEPEAADVAIEDVVLSLGKICRFLGHTRQFYSVLQHSVYVARISTPGDTYAALLHDAAEAYIGDIVSPVGRQLIRISGGLYSGWKKRIEAVVAEALFVPWPMPPAVAIADKVVLATEARDLFPGCNVAKVSKEPPAKDLHIEPWPEQTAQRQFLSIFNATKPRHVPLCTWPILAYTEVSPPRRDEREPND